MTVYRQRDRPGQLKNQAMFGKSNVNSALGFPYSHLLSLQANNLKKKTSKNAAHNHLI